jgi:ABC-type dipeptide/oligopeptide/nickel transport system ATPase component
MTALLEVARLTVRFGEHTVVDDVSFSLERGERLAIIGESGSGKTLTALSLIGLTPETATVTGSVRFDGREVVGRRERHLKDLRGEQIAMVFQNPQTSLDPLMRVGKQVAEPLRRHHGLGKSEAMAAAAALCDRVGLPDPERIVRSYPHQLSGGQRQRIGIAMALACRPALLVADEPTTALDVTVQADVLALLAELIATEDTSLLFITHDVALVPLVADDLVVMRKGTIVERGPAADVIAAPRHDYTTDLIAAARKTALPPDEQLEAVP